MAYRVYQVAVRHPGLNAYRVISGTDWYTVNMKARFQYEAWEREWQKREARRAEDDARRRAARAKREESIRRCREWAASQTADATAAIEAVRRTLARARHRLGRRLGRARRPD
jgi:hypothetical protein